MLLTLQEATLKYGEIQNGVWANEGKWCSLLNLPGWLGQAWINSATGIPLTHIYCNRDLQAPLLTAFGNLFDADCMKELRTFGGCFMIRSIRGNPNRLSTHAYALALDINEKEMPLGSDSTLSDAFVGAFKDAGFLWGGDFSRKDPMHFQYADW